MHAVLASKQIAARLACCSLDIWVTAWGNESQVAKSDLLGACGYWMLFIGLEKILSLLDLHTIAGHFLSFLHHGKTDEWRGDSYEYVISTWTETWIQYLDVYTD